MGLFDIFKNKTPSHSEKIDAAYERFNPSVLSQIFHGSKAHADIVISSLAKLLDVDLETADAQVYHKLMAIHVNAYMVWSIARRAPAELVGAVKKKAPELIKDTETAVKVASFCILNIKDEEFSLTTEHDMDILSAMAYIILTGKDPKDHFNKPAQAEDDADEEYGLVPQKPVFTRGVGGSRMYLNSLQTESGEDIVWTRLGCTAAEGVRGMIDVYKVSLKSGEVYKNIYINMYGSSDPTRAPKGFVFKSKG